MEAAEQVWRPLGELLLSKNLIARAELDAALAEQEETGGLLGAILVDRGFISGPALAIALAEQYGVELDQQQGFGTGLWAEIERRHRSERGLEEPGEIQGKAATVVKLAPPQPPLEAVPDPEPEPDPELERLAEENRRLQDEIERLHTEFTQLRVIEPEPDPELERLEEENRRLQEELERLQAEVEQLQVPDPKLEVLESENGSLQERLERLHAEVVQLKNSERQSAAQIEPLESENRRLQEELERVRAEVAQLQAPDPKLEVLESENGRLQEETQQLQAQVSQLQDSERHAGSQIERLESEKRGLQEDIDRLQSELAQLSVVEPEPELPKTHVLFVPTPMGYVLLEREGPPPDSGTELSLSEGSFVVGKVGRAPVPGERRACAFLLARAYSEASPQRLEIVGAEIRDDLAVLRA